MNDNPLTPSNPNDPSNPSQPRRPRRPYGQRPTNQGQRHDHRSKYGISSPQRNQPQKTTGQTDGQNQRGGPRRRIPEKTTNSSSYSHEHGPYIGNRRKPSDKRNNHEPRSTEETIARPPSVPLKAVGGIKALTENGQFGRNWWARRWIHAMEKLMDGRRLSRGQDYAAQGQVLSMGEIKNGVAATVQGSRVKPYRVTIQVMPLKAEEWEKALDVLASQAVFAAKLLAGEMPENIEEAFQSAGLSLFPERPGDLVTQCSCPDWANPCKHVAAAHYILGDRFDEDPFLLFRMRGRSQEQVLEGLRLHRGGLAEEETPQTVEEPSIPLVSDPENFWEPGEQLSGFSVQIKMPKVSLPILRRLGQPEIIRTFLIEDELGAAYESASQAAMFLAYSDSSGVTEETASGSESEEDN
ncbi:SWIM zinc finger family protein [Leptolinea tardivitalis]|uniref:SWIM zinc finger family protein n=1 Tax=Leptolinea tardivitalis TaxID=229920 RepID=UPI00078552D1|nr:SWIM zinc finger family protein [Leptolinea tardivitalis]GAP20778.1 uncharacterized conserved protein [Leptolinea tardivitalis]